MLISELCQPICPHTQQHAAVRLKYQRIQFEKQYIKIDKRLSILGNAGIGVNLS